VSLKTILGQPGGAESRFVVVRTPDRDCVLAVDSVETIASIDERGFSPLPSLLHGIEAARAIAAADRDLMVTLDLAMVASMLPAADKVPE
jgi:chemotaxis signal transduction protein